MRLKFGKRGAADGGSRRDVGGVSGGSAGTAVLEAPEENYASEWTAPEPAPAGTLRGERLSESGEALRPAPEFEAGGRGGVARRNPGRWNVPEPVAAAGDGIEAEEEPYRARRESLGYRLRLGVPATVAGKVALGGLALLLVGGAGGAVWVAARGLQHDQRFVIASSADIQITGNTHLTRAQILSVFGEDLERNLFKVPLAERKADLERLPWVAHATVMRLLPNRLRVSVVERTPVAYVREGNQIELVDGSGVLLDMPQEVAGDPHYSFPVLTGLSNGDPLPVRAARMEVYRRFMTDLDSGGAKVTENLSEVDVTNPEDVKALIQSGSSDVLVHFGDQDFLARYKVFEQNLPGWKQQYPKLASVDTRYGDQFVLEMQPGAAVPLAGDATAQAAPTPGNVPMPGAGAGSAAGGSANPAAKAGLVKASSVVPRGAHGGVRNGRGNAKLAGALAAARRATPPHTVGRGNAGDGLGQGTR